MDDQHDQHQHEDPLAAARGIIFGVISGLILWAIFGGIAWLLS